MSGTRGEVKASVQVMSLLGQLLTSSVADLVAQRNRGHPHPAFIRAKDALEALVRVAQEAEDE